MPCKCNGKLYCHESVIGNSCHGSVMGNNCHGSVMGNNCLGSVMGNNWQGKIPLVCTIIPLTLQTQQKYNR